VFTRFFDDRGYRLSRHQTLVCHGDLPFDCGQCSPPIRMRALECGMDDCRHATKRASAFWYARRERQSQRDFDRTRAPRAIYVLDREIKL
jgi:hypothetical protein